MQSLGQELSVKIKDSLYQNDAFYKLPPTQRDEHHAVVRLDRIHAQQQESTLACDTKTLEKKQSPDHNQEIKKYTPEIEKQERMMRERQESLEREKQLKIEKN